jgi:hypothetical protein
MSHGERHHIQHRRSAPRAVPRAAAHTVTPRDISDDVVAASCDGVVERDAATLLVTTCPRSFFPKVCRKQGDPHMGLHRFSEVVH